MLHQLVPLLAKTASDPANLFGLRHHLLMQPVIVLKLQYILHQKLSDCPSSAL